MEDSLDARLDRALEAVDGWRVQSFDTDEEFLASLSDPGAPTDVDAWFEVDHGA